MADSYHWDNCPTCHIHYAFPTSLYDRAQQKKPDYKLYCPMGHTWWYVGETEAAKERRLRQRAEQENARLAEEAAAEQRKRLKAERSLKQHQKRAAAGTCPCCKRTFANMAQHMKTKHPGFAADNVVSLKV